MLESHLALCMAIPQNSLKSLYSAHLARHLSRSVSRRHLPSKRVRASHLLRDGIPSIRVISSAVLHNPQVILAQLPDISVQNRPTGSTIPVQLLGFELHVVELVPHLMQSIRKALTFHESQRASRHGTQCSQDGNARVGVEVRQAAEDYENGAEHELQQEQGVGEDVENAVLGVDVLVLCDDPRVHAVFHAQFLWVLGL
jgi:hypothetical protein